MMKVQLLSLFLLAQGALAKNHRVKIQNEQPKSKGRKLTNFQCTIMIKAVMHADDEGNTQHVEEIPECHLSGSALPVPLVNMPSWLSEKFINEEVVSNADSLQLSEALVHEEGIYIPSEAQASFIQGPEERRNRRLTKAERSVVAMRITNAGQDAPSETRSALADSIFGSSGDVFNLKSGYNGCTYGQLTFTEGTGNGIINVRTSAANEDNSIINAALANAGLDSFSYDHVMACLPPDTLNNGSSSWIAWAYVGWYLSAYKGKWCSYPSSQMHEIGHNINFAHSGVGSNEYADGSCMLGYSYSQDEGPVMCFAAPKYYQLGWLSDRHVDISNGGSWTGKIYGISHYSSSSSGDATVVRIDANSDLYVSYNLAKGISSGTQEAANQVIVHSKSAGPTEYGLSYIEKTLNVGDTKTVAGNVIKFLSTGNGFANIRINDFDDDMNNDDTECADDPAFFIEKKNGQQKFCNWFGKKKVRCYRKPGAIDACPVSCAICDKSNAEICTDSRIRRKACKAASMCFWDKSTSPKTCGEAS